MRLDMKTLDHALAEHSTSLETAGGSTTDSTSAATYFDPETIVSLDAANQPLSRYGDLSWDISVMSTDGGHTTTKLYFFDGQLAPIARIDGSLDLAALIREQHKALLWQYMEEGRAQKTIVNSCSALSHLAKCAWGQGISLFDLMTSPELLGDATAGMNSSYAFSVQALLKTLWRHRAVFVRGLEVRLTELQQRIKKDYTSTDETNQTPLIPSRIYCSILASLLSSLGEIERRLDGLLDAYREERAATASVPEGLSVKQRTLHREKLLTDLYGAMRALGWEKGAMSEFIAGQLIDIQVRLMTLVIAFTGMRIGEAQILPLTGVLEAVEHQGEVHHVVHGFSHKLNHGRKKPASWVTSHEGHKAIELAKRIAITIWEVHMGPAAAIDDGALLFSTTNNPYKKIAIPAVRRTFFNSLLPEICPLVTQADIDELNALELERNWMRDGIDVGKRWPLAFHQLRRSLSVYAHRSGLVSLPALKGQLQHITDEMRAYYSDGFCKAVNLVFDKEHFAHEWREAKAESSFLGFSLAVLFGDDDLVGGRGAHSMNRTITTRSKDDTLKLFQAGKLAYRETVLGGCTSLEACDRLPLSPIPFDCLERDCPNAVVLGKRLNLVIRSQETLVSGLAEHEAGSVEHRMEAEHLRVLLRARTRLEQEAA